MEHGDFVSKYLIGAGVEIGAFRTPIPGIKPTYVDRFAEYAGEPTLADYYGDACEIPFHDSSLGYVASSHVLEHVANPLAAIREWFRAIRPGGHMYLVVPDRRKTFDHLRPLTSVSHMIDDWNRSVTQCDGTHIEDFVFGVDWKMFSPSTAPSEEQASRKDLARVYRNSVDAGLEINIHFHTFEASNLASLIESGNREALWPGGIEIVEVVESFPSSCPNGFLLVGRVGKNLRSRCKAMFPRRGLRRDARKIEKARPVGKARPGSDTPRASE